MKQNKPGAEYVQLAKEMIQAAGLPIRGSYRPGEVRKILGISEKTFSRMTNEYEENPATGAPVNPGTLDSFQTLGQKRVPFTELAAYMARNNTYEKNHSFYGVKLPNH